MGSEIFFTIPRNAFIDCEHYEGFPAMEGLRTHCKVTEEQSLNIQKFGVKETCRSGCFGEEGGNRSDFSSMTA